MDSLGQRTDLATDGSAFSVKPALSWSYNERGELTEANDSSASSFDRAYQYDGIGNCQKTVSGLLTDLPPTSDYVADALNQYDSVTLGGTTLSPVYDLDGNATSYPLPVDPSANSTLVWDGENRLISVTTPTSDLTTFEYDYLGRRIVKVTTTADSSTNECFYYDGWNPIVEKRVPSAGGAFHEIRLYTWGLDLSGSMQGAGGVGGLLAIERQSDLSSFPTTTDHYYPTYDGNGNVSEYLDDAGVVVAHFEYDPFGNTPVDTDTAEIFDIRFSTKKRDSGTGLYYYGYRYYDPVTGRWPSRDPLGERGGINLYGMVGNSSINWIDLLGLIGEAAHGSCTVKVVLGHGTLGNRPEGCPNHPQDNPFPDTIHDHFNNGGNLAGDGCSYGGVLYIRCNANDLNNNLPPYQHVPSPDLPYDPDHPWGEEACAWDESSCENMLKTLEDKIEDAEKKAKELCQNCCENWAVEIELLPDIVPDPPAGVGANHPAAKACEQLQEMGGKFISGKCSDVK